MRLYRSSSLTCQQGVRVARYLDNASVFPAGSLAGKSLLDLGSGCGLVSAVAAKLGAKVLATDKDIVMDVLRDNLTSNQVLAEGVPVPCTPAGSRPLVAGKVIVEELWWGPSASHPFAPFDIVIAAACLYMPKTVPLLLDTLWLLSGPQSTVILAGIIGQDTLARFTSEIGRWFEYEVRDDDDERLVGSSVDGSSVPGLIATRILYLKRKEVRLPPRAGEEEEGGEV